jgi:hypothetical protein
MVTIKTIETANLKRKLAKARSAVNQAGGRTVYNLAELGKAYARYKVPKGTGRTASFIKAIHKKTPEPISEIQAQNPTRNGAHRWGAGKKTDNYPNFNLVKWMHTSARAPSHFTNGEHDFMDLTKKYLNRKKKGIAKGNFSKITLR